MSRCNPGLHKGGTCRQTQRRLSDVLLRSLLDALAEIIELSLARCRADEHSVTTCAVDLFDNEVRKMGERVFEIFFPPQNIGGYVRQQRFLTEIEAHHLGHVWIDRFVVRDTSADRVRNRDPA